MPMILRANDLVWPYVVNNYLLGAEPAAFDLLYWNSDSTNLPGPMYCYYLRNTYLHNRLRQPGALENCGVPVDLTKVQMPVFVLATREDHIVPWRSAYRTLHLVGSKDKRFVLGASGHIAGVINPAAKKRRSQPRRLIREAGLKAKYAGLRLYGGIERALQAAEEYLKTAPERGTSLRDLPPAK